MEYLQWVWLASRERLPFRTPGSVPPFWDLLVLQYAISQLRIVRSVLHLVTYLDVGNFCDKRTETTLHEICVQVFLGFSNSNKSSQSVSLIYELA